MKTRNAEVLGEKCVGCTSWYTGMGCTNERCPNGNKGAGSEDVPCDQPCGVLNDLAKEVDELKEQVFDYTQAIGNEVVINMKLKEENADLRDKLVALRDAAESFAPKCDCGNQSNYYVKGEFTCCFECKNEMLEDSVKEYDECDFCMIDGSVAIWKAIDSVKDVKP
jgi:regulator of replication initiation timing